MRARGTGLPRTGAVEQKRRRRVVGGVVAALAVAAVSIGLSGLEPAAPSAE